MKLDAVDFYVAFRRDWSRNASVKAIWGKASNKVWTKVVLIDVLERLGKNLGFEVVREAGGRIDERWLKNSQDEVAIEYENWGEDVEYTMSDARKLLSNRAPLKVLITWVSGTKLDYFVRKWTDALLSELNNRAADTGKLLLILGNSDANNFPGEWFAVLFEPKYMARPLYYSVEGHRYREATVVKWMKNP
jgi:hypothetical protein